jgi:two-component system NtrC family sensor kinase
MKGIRSHEIFSRLIPIILIIGTFIMITVFYILHKEKKHTISGANASINSSLYWVQREISELNNFSQINLEGIDIQYLSQIEKDKYFYQFSFNKDSLKLLNRPLNNLNEKSISKNVNDLLLDSIHTNDFITLIENNKSTYLAVVKIYINDKGNQDILLTLNKFPFDSLMLAVTGNLENTTFCGIKIDHKILLTPTINSCLQKNINDNLLSVNNTYQFECYYEGKSRNFIGKSEDLNDYIKITSISELVNYERIWVIVILITLILLLITVLSYNYNRNNQRAQLLEIKEAVIAISRKEFNHKLPDTYKGELGILAKAINEMGQFLKETYKDLEIRVIRRTSEISMRNAELRKTQRELLSQNHELRSTYEALKESREKYEKLIFHLEEEYIFYSQSINGDILFASPSVTKILGYEITEYRKLYDSLFTDNPINIIARERSLNSRNGIMQPKYLKEIFAKDSSTRILEISEVPIFNDDGQLVSIEGLAHDITERQKAEEVIKEQEEKYRMLFTHASDIIFLYEINKKTKKPGNIIEANNYMLEKMGYSIEELREKTPMKLLAAEIWEDDSVTDSEFIANDAKYERIWETKSGEVINVEISSHVFNIRKKSVAIAVARDITQRKQAEDEIRFINDELYNQKENLEALVDNLTQTQEQLVQSEKMAALGQLIAGIAHEINTPLGAIKASIGNLSDSLDHALGELPSLFQEQSLQSLRLFTKIFELSRKKSRELSSREKRQLKKEILKILMDKGVGDPDTLADLMVYLEIYEIDDDLITQLKNPDSLKVVRSARNFISLVKNTNTINLAVEKATKVVFALKKYAHRDAMGEKVSTDIIDSIETVLTLYNNQLKQGVEVVREYEKLPLVQCYQDEISQVWTNLIQNAIQAMKLEGTLTIYAHLEGNQLVVGFKDTGPGIDPDIKYKIFDPFFTTKKQGEGSGLGLDIVKKIIEKHDGTIDVESTMGEGANFFIKIPIE